MMNRAAVLLFATMVLWFSGAAHALPSGATGTCQVGCEQNLASCEKKLGAKGRCSRKYTGCLDQCSAAATKPLHGKADRQRIICEQKCDLNGATCAEANPAGHANCAAGRKSCIARCS